MAKGNAKTTENPASAHKTDIKGLSGAIFWCVIGAVFLHSIAVSTVGWNKTPDGWLGLWMDCLPIFHLYEETVWFAVVRCVCCLGLGCLFASHVAIFLYMFIESPKINKNKLIIAFTILIFAAVILIAIGVGVFKKNVHEKTHIQYSYVFAIVGLVLCVASGVLSVVQMHRSKVLTK